MTGFNERKRKQEQARRIAEQMQYRQSQRAMQNGQKRIQTLINKYTEQAIQAEKDGQHSTAIRLATEVKRLKAQQMSTDSISGMMETAYAIGTTSRAMLDMVEGANSVAETTLKMADPGTMATVQTKMMEVDANMQVIREQHEMLMDNLNDGYEEVPNEAGEAYLANLMAQAKREKHAKTIKETNRQLDRLQQMRVSDNGKEL